MDRKYIIASVRDSLAAITVPRFYKTERGYQGELLVQLSQRIALPDQTIVEQEYQKSAHAHGLNCRPDIIIHEPYDSDRHASRTEGNAAVIELKLKANAAMAAEDFESLARMIEVLHYPLGIFINIDSEIPHKVLVPRSIQNNVVCFAVSLRDGAANVIEQ